ncbi:MAG: hypothetical protein WC755_06145 [Candidatus Woesearchaeota archaeon]|jgi:hypothetical protein
MEDDIDVNILKENILTASSSLSSLGKTLNNIDASTEEGLQIRSNIRKKLLELSLVAQNFHNQTTFLLEEETIVIKDNLRKREENLARIHKELNELPSEKEVETVKPTVLVNKSSSQAWADIAAKEPSQLEESFTLTGKKGVLPITPGKMITRQISHGVSILAFTIKDPKECGKKEHLGYWCYSTNTERFHTSLNNMVITASTMNITPKMDTPRKFLEHKACSSENYRSIDYRENDFYIPPEIDPSSKDVRQLTDRMHFWPASLEPPSRDFYIYRLGSKDTLKDDLNYMTSSDFRLQMDITGNFMLVITAANATMLKSRMNGGI